MIYIKPDAVKVENLSIVYSPKFSKYIMRDRSKPRCQIPLCFFNTLDDVEVFLESLKNSDATTVNKSFLEIDFKNEKDLFIAHLENLLIEIKSKG